MADGFITRRGGGGRFYEGELTLDTQTAEIDLIGFEPKTLFLYREEGGATNSVMNSFFVAFNGSDVKGCCYRNTSANVSQIFTSFENVATITKASNGVTIALSGNFRFNGTYTVIATA